jgi:hypothetical protein
MIAFPETLPVPDPSRPLRRSWEAWCEAAEVHPALRACGPCLAYVLARAGSRVEVLEPVAEDVSGNGSGGSRREARVEIALRDFRNDRPLFGPSAMRAVLWEMESALNFLARAGSLNPSGRFRVTAPRPDRLRLDWIRSEPGEARA